MATATAGDVQTTNYNQLATQLSSVQHFIDQVTAVLVNIQPPDIDPLPAVDYSAATANLYNLLQITPPTIGLQLVNVPIPAAPTLAFDTIGDVVVPEFAVTPPSINIVDAPAIVLPSVPAQPSITDIALPTAPAITLPTSPTLTAINIPAPPSISIPSFTSTLPPEDFLTPTNNFSFAEQPYVSAMLDADKAKLLSDLQNGGYGIEPLDEQGVYQRGRDREVEATLMEIDEVYRAAGARGFPLPPADTQIMVERALQKQQEKLSTISREIMIKRADQFVENRKFTFTEVRSLETVLMNYWNSVQERGLNAAKATLDAAIAIYETQLKRFTARLDAYRTDAQVFETKVRAVATQIEIYRTQIQAAQVSVEIQRVQVEVYNAQLKGVETTVEIYKTQMEAANIASQVQRTKIEAFRSLIDAYTAQVQAQVAVQNAYEAKTRGELAKAQVYETQARAYSAQVEGLKVKSEVLINKARAQWEQARVRIESYKGQLEGADITLKAQLGIIEANIKTFQAQSQQYIAQTNALAEQFKLDETAIENSRSIQVKQAEVQIATAQLRLQRSIETLKIQAQGLAIGGDYWKNVIAAISGSIQAIATVNS